MPEPQDGDFMTDPARFHSTPLQWPPPWNEIDEGVREVVRALVDAGFVTLASCDGHGERWPQVNVKDAGGGCMRRLIEWLQKNGLAGCYVAETWAVNTSKSDGPFIHIEWWTDRPIRDWQEARNG